MVIFNSYVKLPHCNCPTACLLVKRDFFNTKPKVIKLMELRTQNTGIWLKDGYDGINQQIFITSARNSKEWAKQSTASWLSQAQKITFWGATHQRSLVCAFFTAEGLCAVSCLISQLAFPARSLKSTSISKVLPVLPVLPSISWTNFFHGWNPWIWWKNQMRFQCWWQLNLSIEFLIFRVSIWTWLKGPIIYIYIHMATHFEYIRTVHRSLKLDEIPCWFGILFDICTDFGQKQHPQGGFLQLSAS